MRINIRIEQFAGRGRTSRLASGTRLWPMYFVLDDRAVPALLGGASLPDDLVVVAPPLESSRRPPRPVIGPPRVTPRGRRALGQWHVDAHIDSLGESRARVGVALVLTLGDPRSAALGQALAALRRSFQTMLASEAAVAVGFPALAGIEHGAPDLESVVRDGLEGHGAPTGRLAAFDRRSVFAAVHALVPEERRRAAADLAHLVRMFDEPASAFAVPPAERPHRPIPEPSPTPRPIPPRPIPTIPRVPTPHVPIGPIGPIGRTRLPGARRGMRRTRADVLAHPVSRADEALVAVELASASPGGAVDAAARPSRVVLGSLLLSWPLSELRPGRGMRFRDIVPTRFKRLSFAVSGRVRVVADRSHTHHEPGTGPRS